MPSILVRRSFPWIAVALCSVACAGKASDAGAGGSGGAQDGDAGSGGAHTGSGGSSGGTAGSGGGEAFPATIVLTNDSDETVWVQTAGRCANIPVWFTISEGGDELTVVGSCVTDCATYDPDRGPIGCPAICLVDEYEPLEVGESIEFDWDGASWVSEPSGCSVRTPVSEGASIDVEFCVADGGFDLDGPRPEAPEEQQVLCEKVTVTHGESGRIEHRFTGF